MALQVWLPLNGNIDNKGISSVSITSGTPTYIDSPMGQGYDLSSRTGLNTPGLLNSNQFTIMFWTRVDTCTVDWVELLEVSTQKADGSASSNFRFEATISSRACSWHNNTGYAISNDTETLITNKGEWHHVCVSYDGTSVYSYRDGILLSTKSGNGGHLLDSIVIGSPSLTGVINDVRIYNECLSLTQIKEVSKCLIAHYKLSGDGGINLLPLGGLKNQGASSVTYDKYTDTYTIVSPVGTNSWGYGVCINQDLKVTIPYGADYRISAEVYVPTAHTLKFDYNNVSADSATLASWGGNDNDNTSTRLASSFSIPAGQWTRIVAGSSNTHASNTAGVGIVEYSLFGLYTANDTESVTWYIRHPKVELGSIDTKWSPGGLGYLSQENDLSGYGNTLSFSTIKPHGVGEHARYTGSYQFHGKNTEYMYGNTLDWLTPPFTFNCWCNQTSRTSEKGSAETTTVQFVESQGRDCGLAGFSLVLANGVPRLYLGTETDGTYHQINSDTALALNTWHMLTGTYDGTTVKLYVDGVLKASKAVTTAIDWAQATGFTIGKMAYLHTTTTNYFPFNGYINDVRVYATALSADDISKLYHTGVYIDNKGYIGAYEFIEEA